MSNQRNQSIDLVKIIAMFGVMCLHTTLLFDTISNPISRFLFVCSGISIPLFFIVSGYLMIGKGSSHNYLRKKIFKIIRFVVIITAIFEFSGYFDHQFSIKHIVSNSIFCLMKMGGIGVFWYFGAIIILYISLPFLDKIYKYSRVYNLILVFLFIIITTIHTLNYSIKFEQQIPQTFRVWNWFFYFMLGGFIKRYRPYFVKIHNQRNIETPRFQHKKLEWHPQILTKIKNNMSQEIAWRPAVVDWIGYALWERWGGGKILYIILLLLYMAYCIIYTINEDIIGAYGVEYFFGNILCIVLTINIFVIIITHELPYNRLVTSLSSIFLPVYAFHMLILKNLVPVLDLKYLGILEPLGYLFIVWGLSISLGLLLIKLPYVKNIFKL